MVPTWVVYLSFVSVQSSVQRNLAHVAEGRLLMMNLEELLLSSTGYQPNMLHIYPS